LDLLIKKYFPDVTTNLNTINLEKLIVPLVTSTNAKRYLDEVVNNTNMCDTGHPIMKDSYLTMDTMKFIEAYDVWNQYPKCYRKYMGLMADKDTLSLMGGNCLRRLTYIAIQIAARRDPSIKNLKFVLPPDSEPLLQENEEKTTLRRSQRIRRPPQRLDL
ncbi:hypothetical protein T08_9178, partial [Trichinella sp. T8]